ncbi:glycerol kinase [Litoreibacter halocynthiae]|uniref:ATP:glycerol 3-phosphotransferase n=1 Tax=Litoreibacter halocynthiae TaxID=1242689 RepID=A0A4R7LPF5_9RHOB|nr:FGGY family carbohydrate kinase [Litoreibacter halocynthiae]TDT77644.1 glycerol kinase [Litoreibacter halocynthiae]
MRLAGLDQGTTSTRILTLSPEGVPQVVHAVQHQQFYPHEGWVEHDPEELIANIRACIDAVGPIDAIGIDNQGESCLAWDVVTKEALTPVLVWQDNRTSGQIAALKADGHEAEVMARAKLPLDPYFSASKLGWIIRNSTPVQEARKRGTLRLGTTDAFFLDRLTGRFVTDVTTASRTSLMNLERLEWDETLCDLFGVPMECLPQIVPTTGDFGAIETAHGRVPVTASVVDQQAALYGFGCRKTGDAKITFGTGAFALMVTGAEIVNKPEMGLLPTVAWQLDGEKPVFALDGGVYTASAALNWAKSLGLFENFGQINDFVRPSALEKGLVFVPALAGLGCPHWNPDARGIWLGLSIDHGPAQMVQSILEGVALRASEVVNAMNTCIQISGALAIDGGMSQNQYFTQFLADVTEREIRPAEMPELTGLGTIGLTAVPMGIDLQPTSQFGSIQPEAGISLPVERFQRAVAASKNFVLT